MSATEQATNKPENKKQKKRLSLSLKILLGMILGLIIGLIFREQIAGISFIGDIFMRLLRMCIYPLVLLSIIRAVGNVANISRLRKVGGMFLIYVVVTSTIAAIFGVVSCIIFKPGLGMTLPKIEAGEMVTAPENLSLLDTFVGWVPNNPFWALANGEMIQIIFFAVIFGIILQGIRQTDKGGLLYKVVDALDEIMNIMVNGVLKVAPIGVFALMAVMVGTTGTELIKGIGTYILAYYVALLAIFFILLPLIIRVGSGLSIIQFYKNIFPVMLMAATTMSSMGTLPMTMKASKERCGVPSDTVDLLAAPAATINMNGAAASQSTYVFFTMYLYGLNFDLGTLIFIIALGVVMAIGGAGVPGGGVIMCAIMLSIMGLPQTIVPIIAGIFVILDFGCTVLNVLSDTAGMILISKRNGELNEDIYNSSKSLFT